RTRHWRSLPSAKVPGLLHIELDLPDQSIEIFEFPFGPEILDKAHFDILAVNVVVKVEQINFEHALGFVGAHCWSIAEIDHARIDGSIQSGLREIDPVWGKLLAVSA